MKLNNASRSLTWLRWTTALGFIACITPTAATGATINPIDEPPCYMRTQDGRIVNLQSLCSRTPPQSTQLDPATNQLTPRTRLPQAAPTQVGVPPQAGEQTGSHAQGNPDSDDGRY
ncbi:MAG: hypothetical protein KME45_07505 [Stenomitos rutilans HA7619-LM2]|nr:hypothetical protein [Stenomitos rutilans HA7619-LM2]